MHVKKMLIKRFISFLKQILRSKKTIPKEVLNSIQRDTRSTTGGNIRRILLLTKKESIEQISDIDVENIKYAKMQDDDMWMECQHVKRSN